LGQICLHAVPRQPPFFLEGLSPFTAGVIAGLAVLRKDKESRKPQAGQSLQRDSFYRKSLA